jgi:CBS domain-containing protein
MHDFSVVTVGELLQGMQKGGVVTVSCYQTLQQCAAKMASYNISSLIVVDEGKFAGIVTERDFARKGYAERLSFADPVEKIMTSVEEVITINPDITLAEADEVMRENGIRHLPIVDGDGQAVSILSQRDLHFDAQSILDSIEDRRRERYSEISDLRGS